LLPADATTAIFLIAGTTGVHARPNKIAVNAQRNNLAEDNLNIPTSPFEQGHLEYLSLQWQQQVPSRNISNVLPKKHPE
jgi:hypothetical protein